MISGYSDVLSPRPGDVVQLFVSTDAPRFRIEVYRLGLKLSGPLPGIPANSFPGENSPPGTPNTDWNWKPFPLSVPTDWSTGVYIAMLVEVDQSGDDIPNQPLDRSTADGVDRKVMFIVRAPQGSESQILFKVPTATYQAYNYTGGGSSYRDNGPTVSLRRPGNGTGGPTTFAQTGTPYPQTDVYDPSSDRMKVVHLESRFIHWLEAQGYVDLVDYCTDFDLHFDPAILKPYGLLLSIGHDEYWSESMRSQVVTFLRDGGNVAFFSGNTCYKHITFLNDWQFTNDDTWLTVNKPAEDSFTGVGYRHANGRWDDWRQVVGYTLQHRDHWVLDRVKASVIGDVYNNNRALRAGLIGYECDGAPAQMTDGVMTPTGAPTPPGFVILGYAQLDRSWEDISDANIATMGLYTDRGVAFTVGTVDWARVLDSGQEPSVEQITRNVLNRLGATPRGVARLAQIDDVVACDGMYSTDDGVRHAIVGAKDGKVTEIFFNPTQGQGQTVIAEFDGLIDVASFYTDDDHNRHALTVTSDGNVSEVFFNPTTGIGRVVLSNIPGASRVSGFFSSDDQHRHAIVSTASGAVQEIFFSPTAGQGQAELGRFEDIVDVASFFSPDDGFRHAIVATGEGDLYEVFYSPQTGQGRALLGNVPDVSRISAFYLQEDNYFNRRVIVATHSGRIYQIKYGPKAGLIQTVLVNGVTSQDVGGFYSSDDKLHHVIIASAGTIQELFLPDDD